VRLTRPVAAILALALAAGIWWFSDRQQPIVFEETFFQLLLAKTLHFTLFGMLAFLLLRALGGEQPRPPHFAAALLLAAGWGLLDEWHQSWVPGRNALAWDVVLDAAGAATFLLIAEVVRRRRLRTSA
jgi:VanZ family protein